jgi:Putative Ig domain
MTAQSRWSALAHHFTQAHCRGSILPFSSLPKAAGHSARRAVACLVCFSSITLTACGSGSHFPSAIDRAEASPPTSGTGANDAPIISGKPLSTAVVNVPYVFRPDVHDPDGDVLVFQVTRKPSWATFDPATGELSGVPPASTTGTYTDIAIVVSDGELKTSLPRFSIKVTTSSATGSTSSASLSWSAPTQNEDGSPLTDLAGYRIHYGTSASDLNQRIEIDNPATTSKVVQSLTPGTWFFAISAYTHNGAESSRSGFVSKVIG